MHPILTMVLRCLHPLEIIAATDIIKRYFTWPDHQAVVLRHRIRRELKDTPPGFPPLGDQPDTHAPVAYFGFRWIASTVDKPPIRPPIYVPMDSRTMVIFFPDLREKLDLLENVIVHPDQLHQFLAAVNAWTPIPPRRNPRLVRRYDDRPFLQAYVGISS